MAKPKPSSNMRAVPHKIFKPLYARSKVEDTETPVSEAAREEKSPKKTRNRPPSRRHPRHRPPRRSWPLERSQQWPKSKSSKPRLKQGHLERPCPPGHPLVPTSNLPRPLEDRRNATDGTGVGLPDPQSPEDGRDLAAVSGQVATSAAAPKSREEMIDAEITAEDLENNEIALPP